MSPLMLDEHLSEMLAHTRRLRSRFAATAPMPWDATTAATELLVQIGHLAQCLLRQRGAAMTEFEDPARPIINPGDELADVVLATLSVCTLAGTEPAVSPKRRPTLAPLSDTLSRLSIAAGLLAEAAMVDAGFRHQPAGTPLSVSEASTHVLTTCGYLAEHLGLDLIAEFRAMVVDAEHFLDQLDARR